MNINKMKKLFTVRKYCQAEAADNPWCWQWRIYPHHRVISLSEHNHSAAAAL